MTESSQKCPTCRGSGPDTFDINAETRAIEAECGDVWHDRFVTDKPVSERALEDALAAKVLHIELIRHALEMNLPELRRTLEQIEEAKKVSAELLRREVTI